jgi:lipoprotein-anchoring transpeptidase ErfK/SrfK
MNTRSKAVSLAILAAVALGACSKAPTTLTEVNGQVVPTTTPAVAPSTDPTPTVAPDTTPPVPPGRTTNVQAKVSSLAVHADPVASSPVVTTLKDKTKLGSKTTLLALDSKDGWVQVALPTRPNGSQGWVEAGDVQPRTDDFAINVDLGAKKITVQKNGQSVLESPVAVGADSTPTPKGTFYTTDLLDTGNANGDYGPFAFGLSGHSDTLTEFAGGDGQIGIHGTDDPSSIGKAVSHGCVRMPNDVITKLATMIPLGTPVTIA